MFAQLCQTIAVKSKMKTLFERCLSNYTLMEIFLFCLTFCVVKYFANFYVFCWFTLHVTD